MLKEVFIKKYWPEEDILFYLHFKDEEAMRQIEITSKGKVNLSTESPINGESMLYDQDLKGLELNESDFITKEEFDRIWNT